METNLFIKSYKTEGNKITDLKFYGDMEIDIGEAPVEIEVLSNYVETRPFIGDAYPYGTYMKEVYLEDGKYHFNFRNDAPWSYFCVFSTAGGILTATLPSKKMWNMRASSNYVTGNDAYLYIFTEDKKRCVGIVYLTGLVG
jgi:hypothetical protein